MNRSAIGFTAFPEYPETEHFPLTPGQETIVSRSTRVRLFTVFIAAMPSAPPSFAAVAGTSMLPMFGVIFASTGSFVPRFAAAV